MFLTYGRCHSKLKRKLMNDAGLWKVVGVLFAFAGIMAVLTGRAGLKYGGSLEGLGARVVGILMIIYGAGLIFLIKKKKK
jgi:hypothetical protein